MKALGIILLGLSYPLLQVAAQLNAPPNPACSLQPSGRTVGLKCEQRGDAPEVATAKAVTIGDVDFETCRDNAGQLSLSYKSFAYNSETRRCRIFRSSVAQQGFAPNSQSTRTFSDVGCYSCPAKCSNPDSSSFFYTENNAIFNDSTRFLGPWYSSKNAGLATNQDVTGAAQAGRNVWRFEAKKSTTGPIRGFVSQAFRPCPVKYYYLLASWQIEADPASNSLASVRVGDSYLLTHSGNRSLGGQNEQLFYIINDDAPPEITYSVQRRGSSGSVVGRVGQSVSLPYTLQDLQSGLYTEYIQNGGFEDAKLGPWELLNGARLVHPGISNSSAASGNGSFQLKNNIVLFPQLFYLLQFDTVSAFDSATTAYRMDVTIDAKVRTITHSFALRPGSKSFAVPISDKESQDFAGVGVNSFGIKVVCVKGACNTPAVKLDNFSCRQMTNFPPPFA